RQLKKMKLLYATNLEGQALSSSLIETILALRHVGLEEIVFLQTTPFDGWLENLSGLGIKYRILVEEALSLPRILSVAGKEDVSLLVVNLDRKIHNPSHGSLIRGLIKRSSVPVLVLNDTSTRDEELFEHIIFPTNWSPASEKSLTRLLDFSVIIKRLDIVNVINGKLTVKDIRKLKQELVQTRKMCLDKKIDAESHIYAGRIVEEIITASEDYRATLIVLGASPKKPFYKEMFRRNSSCRVAEEAAVPVLVVP
ncbi:MAG: universal stress protein, partial [Thermodesulfobacteriota bacterium]|nr:universal stress protein [Thermodesulfobacteriota bacterium]